MPNRLLLDLPLRMLRAVVCHRQTTLPGVDRSSDEIRKLGRSSRREGRPGDCLISSFGKTSNYLIAIQKKNLLEVVNLGRGVDSTRPRLPERRRAIGRS